MIDYNIGVGGDVLTLCNECELDLWHTVIAKVDGLVTRVKCNTCKTEHMLRGQAKLAAHKRTGGRVRGSTTVICSRVAGRPAVIVRASPSSRRADQALVVADSPLFVTRVGFLPATGSSSEGARAALDSLLRTIADQRDALWSRLRSGRADGAKLVVSAGGGRSR